MNFAEESYFRPRFMSGSDIASLISRAGDQATESINRSGESLARAAGQGPRAFGEGIRNTVESWYRGKEDKWRREQAAKEALRAEEAHKSAMSLQGENLKGAKRIRYPTRTLMTRSMYN